MTLDPAIAAAWGTEAAVRLVDQAHGQDDSAVDLVTVSAFDLCVLGVTAYPLFEEAVARAWRSQERGGGRRSPASGPRTCSGGACCPPASPPPAPRRLPGRTRCSRNSASCWPCGAGRTGSSPPRRTVRGCGAWLCSRWETRPGRRARSWLAAGRSPGQGQRVGFREARGARLDLLLLPRLAARRSGPAREMGYPPGAAGAQGGTRAAGVRPSSRPRRPGRRVPARHRRRRGRQPRPPRPRVRCPGQGQVRPERIAGSNARPDHFAIMTPPR
jgi:hypothetical protein